jgi:2-polyprenyl-3-methyl-5-hydroxy-6-metoxy-1,4-benzoquinol methylase
MSMSIQIESICPLCGSTNVHPYRIVGSYPIVRCIRCSFLFVSPAPTAAELTDFYQQAAYYEGSSLGYSDYLGEQARHEQLARGRLRRIEHMQPKRGRILDVGCAAGFFLRIAQLRGWEPLGVELSREMANMATHLIGRPVAPTLADLGVAPGSLDCITLWEYIEHIPDPRTEIERLMALLRSGGVLALSTPNTGYWSAEHQPERWREFKPPAHLGFFTHATLDQLLRDCGLQFVQILHVMARAPTQPYAFQRMLALLRQSVGSGEDRRTPIWWSFSLAWRLAERLSQAGYQLQTPGCDLHIGLEAYAIKP